MERGNVGWVYTTYKDISGWVYITEGDIQDKFVYYEEDEKQLATNIENNILENTEKKDEINAETSDSSVRFTGKVILISCIVIAAVIGLMSFVTIMLINKDKKKM